MLKDLSKLKGIDFSEKIIYTDGLPFDDLFFMNENWKNSLILDLPDKVDLNTSFEDFADKNYKILYFNILHEIYCRQIPYSKRKYEFWGFNEINCSEIDRIHIINNIIDVAISNNHIVLDSKYYCDNIRDNAFFRTVKELKNILRKYDLPVSGSKSILLDRLFNNLSNEELEYEFPIEKYPIDCKLTKNGLEFVEKYNLFKYREILPIGFKLDEFLLLCNMNSQYSPEEILFCLAYHNWVQMGENADLLSEEYKLEVGNANAEYKLEMINTLIYYHDFAIGLYEKIISDGACEDISSYEYSLEELKESYSEGNY